MQSDESITEGSDTSLMVRELSKLGTNPLHSTADRPTGSLRSRPNGRVDGQNAEGQGCLARAGDMPSSQAPDPNGTQSLHLAHLKPEKWD
ncbi:hypothetical protein KOW79_000670 [Hemibagrus wyckioides]|uniref:Uncharacterized protein n=1 Tax=Hemibagrus wyckioides TaxID=337641 RepID=A0A9D3STC2_9TELE|nr:hypothetical protein KOW79_000670 [Hemibagrus wyckioides]